MSIKHLIINTMNILSGPDAILFRSRLLTLIVNMVLGFSVSSATLAGCTASVMQAASEGSPALVSPGLPATATSSTPIEGCISPASLSGELIINYMVSMNDAVNHNFRITMTLDGVRTDTLMLKMPVWTPGYYWIQNYPKNLSRLEIRDATGRECHFLKTSKNIWKVATGGADKLTASWVIYGNSHSVADAFIDTTHAFIVPAALFLYPEDALAEPSHITLDLYPGWTTVSTGLEPVTTSTRAETAGTPAGTWRSFSAPGYDVLFDSPILAGTQEVMTKAQELIFNDMFRVVH